MINHMSDESAMSDLEVEQIESDAARLGRRRFIAGVGAAGAGAAIGVGSVASSAGAPASALDAGASRFVALPKALRALDTRRPSGFQFQNLSSTRLRLPLAGKFGVPANASAVVLNVVGIARVGPGWLVAFPSDVPSVPDSSNVNMADVGVAVANMVTVKLGNGGIDIATKLPSFVVVDVQGYYEPVGGSVSGGRFVALNSPVRALDSRATPGKPGNASFTTVDTRGLGIPPDASALVVNLTATETTRVGWFVAVPWSQTTTPTTSTLNVKGPWDMRAVAAIVPLSPGSNGRFKIYSQWSSHLVLDVTGYFTSDSSPTSTDGLYVPRSPVRVLDTRWPGHPVGKLWPNWVVEVPLSGQPSQGSAVLVNVTSDQTRSAGHFTVNAARIPIPNASNVNWTHAMATVPNHVITRISNAGFQIFTPHGGHAVVDLQGYFTGTPLAATRSAYVNPPPPAVPPPWTLRIPKIGITSQVIPGDPVAVTDAGHSWPWGGTGYLQQAANIGAFAHRTEAGAPYRNIHTLGNGDRFTVTGGGRLFTYEVFYREITDDQNANILAAVRRQPAPTFALIACSLPDGTPTSLDWRLIVVGRLIAWREI